MLLELLEGTKEFYEWIIPPVETPEQRLGKARQAVSVDTKSLKRKQMRNELEQEDAMKAFNRAANRQDEASARINAGKLVRLERQGRYLGQEQEKISNNENRLDSMLRQQVTQNAQITTMAYSNVRTPNPFQVQGVVHQYEQNKASRKAVNKAINAAMLETDENDGEVALQQQQLQQQQQQREAFTEEEEARMASLMDTYNKTVMQKFIDEQPVIGGQKLSASLLDMDGASMQRKTLENSQLLTQFLSKG